MNTAKRDNTLAIGDIQLPSKAVLAPLAGYTDLSYRTICRRLGAAYAATEVTLDSSINLSPKLRNRLITLSAEDHPLAGQIMGREAKSMATAAVHLIRMGCDVVDLNFACPVRKALRRGRGGHMMRDAESGLATLREVAAAVDGFPLTLKLRKSFDDSDADATTCKKYMETAFDLGFVAICVHGRTVEAGYSGPADWEFLTELRKLFPDKVLIGSGDLSTPQKGLDMLDETGVDGVSFARGALGNPWIFQQFDQLMAGETPIEPSLAEQARVWRLHNELCCEFFGPKIGPKMMYRFAIRYARMHPRAKAVRTAVVNAPRPVDIESILSEFYSDGN